MPNRLWRLVPFLVLFWLFFLGSVLGQPNILLIVGDDQAWSDYGFMGHSIVKTPHLDRLASESLVYRYGYVPTSLCRPSLATLMTGLFPHQHGITGNDPARPAGTSRGAPDYLKMNERLISRMEANMTLPRLLARSGYLSFQAGKWWEGSYLRGGFTHGMTHGDPKRGGRHGDEGLKIGRQGLQPLFDFIASAGETPFFVWYAPFLPHTPHTPPERLLAEYREQGLPVEVSQYYAMCQWFDETVGELLAYLATNGLSENTLVLYLADNGWIQKTKQTPVPSGWNFWYAPGSKRSAKDGGIRTPILLRWPGKTATVKSDTPVSSIDLVPTVLAAVQMEIPGTMPGVNLLDRLAVESRTAIFGDIYTHDVMDLDDPVASLKYRWCVRKPWKLIVPHSQNVLDAELQLFHIVSDPHETENLALGNPEVVEELYREILGWWPTSLKVAR